MKQISLMAISALLPFCLSNSIASPSQTEDQDINIGKTTLVTGLTALHTKNIAANVTIQTTEPQDVPSITFAFYGEHLNEYLNKLRLTATEGVLTLTDYSDPVQSVQVYHNVSIPGLCSHINTLYVGNAISDSQTNRSSYTQLPTIKIRVPRDIPLTLGARTGSWEVGDVTKPLAATITEDCYMTVNSISPSANIQLTGRGSFTAQTVHGDHFVGTVRGSGNIVVQNATVDSLEANVEGSGHLNFHGLAQKAYLRVKGSGNMYVKTVKEVDRFICGSGNLTVGNAITPTPRAQSNHTSTVTVTTIHRNPGNVDVEAIMKHAFSHPFFQQ